MKWEQVPQPSAGLVASLSVPLVTAPAPWPPLRLSHCPCHCAGPGAPPTIHGLAQACKAKTLDAVVVATDDDRIAEVCREAGALVVMTDPDCPNGGWVVGGWRAGR